MGFVPGKVTAPFCGTGGAPPGTGTAATAAPAPLGRPTLIYTFSSMVCFRIIGYANKICKVLHPKVSPASAKYTAT
jgi:hypothetical protein